MDSCFFDNRHKSFCSLLLCLFVILCLHRPSSGKDLLSSSAGIWGRRYPSNNSSLRNDELHYSLNIFRQTISSFLVPERTVKVLTANGQYQPGPLIRARKGDIVHVQVANGLDEGDTVIHWHGLTQRDTPWMDGTPGLTQRPLKPGESQIFTLNLTNQMAGTFWWHSHIVGQTGQGLAGMLIVDEDSELPYDYDDERIIVVGDWYEQSSDQIVQGLLQKNKFRWPGDPQAILVNGKCGLLNKTDVTVIEVEPGKTYRLRFLNVGSLMMLNLAIQGHNLTIVEVEGHESVPMTVPSLEINLGQRYSALLDADQQSDDDGFFWGKIETVHRKSSLLGRFLLKYKTRKNLLRSTIPEFPTDDDSNFSWTIEEHRRLVSHPEHYHMPPEATRKIFINGTQEKDVDVGIQWLVNGKAFYAPGHTVNNLVKGYHNDSNNTKQEQEWIAPLLQAERDRKIIRKEQYKDLNILDIRFNQVVDIILQNAYALNGVSEQHPWHMHGYCFWVMGYGPGVYDEERDFALLNHINPIKRDTVTLLPATTLKGHRGDADSWTVIRVIFDNPGVWLFHCHIAWHLAMGMAITFVVDPTAAPDPPEDHLILLRIKSD